MQKPWAKPAGNPRSVTPPRAASETTFHGSRVPSAKNGHGGGNARRHSITASLPADMGMQDVVTNPVVSAAGSALLLLNILFLSLSLSLNILEP